MWSRWSHSAVWDQAEGVVYDASFKHKGFRAWPQDEWFARYPKREVRDLGLHDPGAARRWLRQQIGKPYDWTAIIGFVFRSDWQATDSWFCSEVIETLRNKFGAPVFRADVSRVTPGHQDMIV